MMVDKELTEAEIAELRKMIETERHMKWLWASLRVWVIGIISVVAALTAFRRDITDLIVWLFGGSK